MQRYTKEVRIVIAATAATPYTMDAKEIERRKREHIIDDDEVGDKSSNRPGINDSLACPNKGREKRSGSNVGNVARGRNSPPPPSPRARPRHPPMGGRRGADQTLPLSRMGASVHLEKELI